MKAPPGAVVRITYDCHDADQALAAGHALVTRSGRVYVVVEARRVERGARAGRRWRLSCVVHDGEVPAGAPLHSLNWYSRSKR